MLNLAKAGNTVETATALGSGETTRPFVVDRGVCVYTLKGDFSGQTVTLQMSPTGRTADFATYVARISGTPATVSYTSGCTDCLIGSGQSFRFVCSSGGTPSVGIFVSGNGVRLE